MLLTNSKDDIKHCVLWLNGLSSFQEKNINLERFLPKNRHTQKKLSNFANWCSGEVSKRAKILLSESVFYVKNHQEKISLKNTNLGAHFLITSIFKSHDVKNGAQFLTARHYTNSQNQMTSFE